jgi:hypothetical protein
MLANSVAATVAAAVNAAEGSTTEQRSAAAAAQQHIEWMEQLPKYLIVELGNERIAILHGDSQMLSGWRFAAEAMEPLDRRLLSSMKLLSSPSSSSPSSSSPSSSSSASSLFSTTSIASMEDSFTDMNVGAICCTHTCLPFAQAYSNGVLFNNGSAGMPNFAHHPAAKKCGGIITRIALKSKETPKGIQDLTLYSAERGEVVYSAIAVNYNEKEFKAQFLEAWPEGSAAFVSYYDRIVTGVSYWTREQAARNTKTGAAI